VGLETRCKIELVFGLFGVDIKMKKVLLIDVDSHNEFPNLVHMKISAHHKSLGDQIEIQRGLIHNLKDIFNPPDLIYVSCIFPQNATKTKKFLDRFSCKTITGGTGLDLKTTLPDSIEHIMPDYDLYDTKYSMGFTSRGCIRNCPWCVVPEKEGFIRDNAPITEFWDPNHKKIILLDNNFLASPKWRESLEFLIDNELKVNFNQGLDIRTVTKKNSKLLAKTLSYDWHFKTKSFYFAFDTMNVKRVLLKNLNLLLESGIPPSKLMFYVLVGFNTTLQQDLERIKLLDSLGIKPFVMRYNQTEGENKVLVHLARWVNRRYYQFMEFKDYDQGDSKDIIKKALGGL